MQTPLRITFRHMPSSPAAEARVRAYVEKIERFNGRITGCHVVIDAPAAHRNKGAAFTVKIDLTVPGREICVDTGRMANAAHADAYVALRDAFDALKRLLQDYAREQRGEVKRHEQSLQRGG